jgi:hypothetical protein
MFIGLYSQFDEFVTGIDEKNSSVDELICSYTRQPVFELSVFIEIRVIKCGTFGLNVFASDLTGALHLPGRVRFTVLLLYHYTIRC